MKKTSKRLMHRELLYELIDSKTVLPCYNSTNPRASLADTKDFNSYKLYLSENLIAKMITASGRELYYHTWKKAGSTHYYEVDFLTSEGSKINAFEIKSSGSGKHESIKEFYKKFSQNVHNIYLLSQKDVGKEENLLLKPIYLMPFLV